MAQIFHHSTNLISRLSIYGSVFILGLLGFALYEIGMSPYYTNVKSGPTPRCSNRCAQVIVTTNPFRGRG